MAVVVIPNGEIRISHRQRLQAGLQLGKWLNYSPSSCFLCDLRTALRPNRTFCRRFFYHGLDTDRPNAACAATTGFGCADLSALSAGDWLAIECRWGVRLSTHR